MKSRPREKQLPKLSSVSRKERATSSPSLEQLELVFARSTCRSGRDVDLELKARELLRGFGFDKDVSVKWNARLTSCAGRADFRHKLITLNPRLHEHGADEIERTFRHELAHLLGQFRAGRKGILPHGDEWRAACVDLGIPDEKRTHTLPFPTTERTRRFLYKCPNCHVEFPRARKIRRAIACLACCRANNGGNFDGRFRLRLHAQSSGSSAVKLSVVKD